MVEILDKIRSLLLEVKSKVMGEEYITFDVAVQMLKRELCLPDDRALKFVKHFDKNNDGKLSVTEFNAFKLKLEEARLRIMPEFKKYDADGNGYITVSEASRIMQAPPFSFPADKVIILLRKFDRDGNGKLDIEEFADFYAEAKATQEEMAHRFDELDKDGNGVLTPDEVVHVIMDMMAIDEEMARWMVQMFDQNQDGSLDKAEFMQMWNNMFA